MPERGQRDASDIVVFGGGIIPEADLPELQAMGVDIDVLTAEQEEYLHSWNQGT